MTYPQFPDLNPLPTIGWEAGDAFFTVLLDSFESGVSYSRIRRRYPIYDVKLSYGANIYEDVDFDTLYAFYLSMLGRGKLFTFYDPRNYDTTPIGRFWPYVYLGQGDDTKTDYDIPMRDSKLLAGVPVGTMIVATTTSVVGVDWNFTAAGGSDGICDKATFVVPPPKGALITWSSIGRRRIGAARFTDDRLSRINLEALLMSTGLGIKQVIVNA